MYLAQNLTITSKIRIISDTIDFYEKKCQDIFMRGH